jgi:trehalose 6-phosphate synthase/phosphatase
VPPPVNTSEVRSAEAHKGKAALRQLKPNHDFVLVIGDDRTDEDMFTDLPDSAYSIKVGRGRTNARYRLAHVSEVLGLLQQLSRNASK